MINDGDDWSSLCSLFSKNGFEYIKRELGRMLMSVGQFHDGTSNLLGDFNLTALILCSIYVCHVLIKFDG